MATILLVDDEPAVIKTLSAYCLEAGHEALTATNGMEGLRAFFQYRPQVIVSDIRMPELSGFEMLARIREVADVPVIALSVLGQEADKVQALKLGADDYLVKPVGLKEFTARIEAVLRRARPHTKQDLSIYADGYLTIRHDRQEAFLDNQRLALSPKEFRILSYLTHRSGKPVAVPELLTAVWGSPHYSEDTVKWHIASLRKKVEEDPHQPRHIVTVWGSGYKYDRPNPLSPAPSLVA